MKILTLLTLILLTACSAYVTPVPTSTPQPAPLNTVSVPTGTAKAVTATPELDTAIVRQPIVNVHVSPGGASTNEYIYAGQEVTILERGKGDDADWIRIAEPAGWVFVGCLEGSKKGCVAK